MDQVTPERVAGIEPASSAWKAEVLPLNYPRRLETLVVGEGFEPSKAKPSDLQSDPFDHSGTPPAKRKIIPTPPINAVDEGVKYLLQQPLTVLFVDRSLLLSAT